MLPSRQCSSAELAEISSYHCWGRSRYSACAASVESHQGEDETHETIDASTEGTVGDRPPLRGDLIVDDVVSACG
jgi:hypothetical protein